MLRDGEKYACKACIRGHRVSSCQHADRELFHINKKGRPVSQCHHCRGLRKSRAAHVKCECAEHHHDAEGALGKDDCPCVTGAKCTCAFKKELPDIDEDSNAFKQPHHKPTFQARRSESAVPKARPDGTHHPQHHRTNNSAHQFGIPYTIKRLHSDGTHTHADTLFSPASAIDFSGFDFAGSSSGPSGAAAAQVYPSYIPSSPHDTRLTRSAHASPILGPIAGTSLDENISARGVLDVQPSIAAASFWSSQLAAAQRHSINDFSNFSLDASLDPYAADYEEPSNAATLLGADWSQIGLNSSLDPANTQDYYPPPQSNPSLDFSLSGRPGLSHSSSGTASDAGEPIPNDFGQLNPSLNPVALDPSYGLLGASLPANYDMIPAATNNFNLNLISSLDLGNYNSSVGAMSGGDLSNTGGNSNSQPLVNQGDASIQQPFIKAENYGMGMPFTPPFNDATSTPPLQQPQHGRSATNTPPSLPGLAMPNLPEDDDNEDGSGTNSNNNNTNDLWADFNVYGNPAIGSTADGSLGSTPGTAAGPAQPHWI